MTGLSQLNDSNTSSCSTLSGPMHASTPKHVASSSFSDESFFGISTSNPEGSVSSPEISVLTNASSCEHDLPSHASEMTMHVQRHLKQIKPVLKTLTPTLPSALDLS